MVKVKGKIEDRVYLGIDPGENGGIAAICSDGTETVKMPDTEKDVFDYLAGWDINYKVTAFLEQIDPRPTSWYDKSKGRWTASILKSTCLIYGNYLFLRGLLIASGISFFSEQPQSWQKGLKIPKKEKSETPAQWKNRLKGRAQQLFPNLKITLATADALLMAEYCRRCHVGEG